MSRACAPIPAGRRSRERVVVALGLGDAYRPAAVDVELVRAAGKGGLGRHRGRRLADIVRSLTSNWIQMGQAKTGDCVDMSITLNYWTRRSPFFDSALRAGCKGFSFKYKGV